MGTNFIGIIDMWYFLCIIVYLDGLLEAIIVVERIKVHHIRVRLLTAGKISSRKRPSTVPIEHLHLPVLNFSRGFSFFVNACLRCK